MATPFSVRLSSLSAFLLIISAILTFFATFLHFSLLIHLFCIKFALKDAITTKQYKQPYLTTTAYED